MLDNLETIEQVECKRLPIYKTQQYAEGFNYPSPALIVKLFHTMSSSRLLSPLYLLSFSLLLQLALATNPLFHFCSSSENFTPNSPYEMNLNKLMSYLDYTTPKTGFGTGSLGLSQNQAYGLALCRGDVKTTDCQACVAEAETEIRKRCQFNKGAIIWYDNCMLKYSNLEFFGKVDNKNKFYMWNLRNVSDPLYFNGKTKELLGKLAGEAYVNSKLFATGQMEIEKSKKLYGLVQCTRDLSSVDCKKCIDGAISELPSCCDGKEGGRVVGGSCNVRYEIYPFVNA
ncbi:hypothetical protein RHGRI_017856 [Rhododendron griersonianum]|uniref:Gnk2-homologous domain-containing protein n=1 Tax=Rhododendron griersonianum TaxID=479676 RepID=A0AAV6JZA1_9ERIC|nr:hypothetical protein RHGRI_017856 [Rhododendron griersonianum]